VEIPLRMRRGWGDQRGGRGESRCDGEGAVGERVLDGGWIWGWIRETACFPLLVRLGKIHSVVMGRGRLSGDGSVGANCRVSRELL
jgi:hypothetical protein